VVRDENGFDVLVKRRKARAGHVDCAGDRQGLPGGAKRRGELKQNHGVSGASGEQYE
jgi:hypothetical protein